MDQVTTGTGPVPEDEALDRFGYRQQFVRSLGTLFTASTIMPALLYSGTVLLYVFTSRRPGAGSVEGTHPRPFGKMEIPVIAGALIWLAYELIVLIGPAQFRDAQYYVLGSLGVGLVFYVVQLITEPRAMRTEPGQEP